MIETLVPLRPIGAGGEGTVWLAWDPALSRWLAVKIVKLAEGARGRGQELLASLAPVAREFLEPAVAPALECGFTDGWPAAVRERFGVRDGVALYVVLPWIRGLPANELARGPLDARAVAALLVECTRLLARLHAQGLAHLDVKPSNVLVDTQGRAWLVDMHLSTLGGTSGYAAPEQREGLDGEARGALADWYSLGRTLAALWSGEAPRASADPLPELPRPAVTLSGPQRLAHEQLAELVAALTEPDPARRAVPVQSEAERLARDLGGGDSRQILAQALAASPHRGRLAEIEQAQAAYTARTGAASPPAPPPTAAAAARPRRLPLLALGLTLPVALAAWFLWRPHPAEPSPGSATLKAAAAPKPIGEILDPDVVRTLGPREAPRPGHGDLIISVEGPSSGKSWLQLLENPGHPLWTVDSPPPFTGTRLELPGPHTYMFFTPIASGIMPHQIYIDGKDPAKLTPEEIKVRPIAAVTINGTTELAPPGPPEDWNDVQKEPGRALKKHWSLRDSRALLSGPFVIVALHWSGPGTVTWNVTPHPCDEPRTPFFPSEITPTEPYTISEQGTLWACMTGGAGPLKVQIEGYRPK